MASSAAWLSKEPFVRHFALSLFSVGVLAAIPIVIAHYFLSRPDVPPFYGGMNWHDLHREHPPTQLFTLKREA